MPRLVSDAPGMPQILADCFRRFIRLPADPSRVVKPQNQQKNCIEVAIRAATFRFARASLHRAIKATLPLCHPS